MAFEGEYCHPYIDKEIENPTIRHYVTHLISEEMQNTHYVEPVEEVEILPEYSNWKPSYSCFDAEQQDLFLQESYKTLLLQRQSEYWHSEIQMLENLIRESKEIEQNLKDEIENINVRRYLDQTSKAPDLQNLRQKEERLKEQIVSLEKLLQSK